MSNIQNLKLFAAKSPKVQQPVILLTFWLYYPAQHHISISKTILMTFKTALLKCNGSINHF